MKEVMKAGDRIGHYVIEDCIGSGSMGEVYRAHPEGADNFTVAIKLFNPRQCLDLDDKEAEQRWQVEYDAMQRMAHPNIARILHPGVHKDSKYICMNYIEGPSLGEMIKKEPISVHRGLSIAQHIADGLKALHGSNIIHRDLKPSNVIISPGDHPTIIDFGISVLRDRRGSRITLPGMILGTPGYVPPEVMDGDSPEKPADVYALGILTLETLGGKVNRFDPRLALLRGAREKIFNIDLESAVKVHGPEYQYLTSVLEPMICRNPRDRATAAEAEELIKWGLRRTNHTETKKFDRKDLTTPLEDLLIDAAVLEKHEFMDIHADVNGIFTSPGCYERLTDPTHNSSKCGCTTYIISGLQERELVLGREAEVFIPGNKISRQHASLIISSLKPVGDRQYRIMIKDLQSRNGTYVNNIEVRPGTRRLLRSNDIIDFGRVAKLQFTYPGDLYDRVAQAAEGTNKHWREDFG